MGIYTVMLTGDNKRTAQAIAKQAGVDKVIAGVLPDGKEEAVRKLSEYGKVMMIGDGINDAPALTRANVGMAIGAGTDVAIDAADVVLVKSRLTDAAAAIRLSRATYRNIIENMFWAFIYNVLLIPLAAGVYSGLGAVMNPMWGAAAMSLSSVFVVANALRLNLFSLYSSKRDKHSKQVVVIDDISEQEKEVNVMIKTMKIKGMMCHNCESHVKKALEAIDGVEVAEVSHAESEAVVTLSADVADSVLKEAVENSGYEVLDIK